MQKNQCNAKCPIANKSGGFVYKIGQHQAIGDSHSGSMLILILWWVYRLYHASYHTKDISLFIASIRNGHKEHNMKCKVITPILPCPSS